MPQAVSVLFNQPESYRDALGVPTLRALAPNYLPKVGTAMSGCKSSPDAVIVQASYAAETDERLSALTAIATGIFKPFLPLDVNVHSIDFTSIVNPPDAQNEFEHPPSTIGIVCLVGSGLHIVHARTLLQPNRWQRTDRVQLNFEQGGVLFAYGADRIRSQFTNPGMHILVGLNTEPIAA